MRYFYPRYMQSIFEVYGLPAELIDPAVTLCEKCWALRMNNLDFNELLQEHDISNLEVLLALIEELSARLVMKNEPLAKFYAKYPILHPNVLPEEQAKVILGCIHDAYQGSEVHVKQLQAWVKKEWYPDQIRLLIKLWNSDDDLLWYRHGMPGSIKPWEEKQKEVKNGSTDVSSNGNSPDQEPGAVPKRGRPARQR